MSTSPYVCKWGILATGGIAATFSKDLLIDPTSRSVSDVKHEIVAAASSTSASRASDFLKDIKAPSSAKAYGSYDELVADPDVDIIYIATPHSHHYENALLCLEAGKNVCCEKPFTINAAQAEHLVKIARAKNLFMMEAVWIRFFPIVLEIQRLLHEDKVLGKIQRVFSDFGMQFKPDPKHRLYNPDLGGGALLDLGIYALSWQMIVLFDHPDNKGAKPDIKGSMLKTPLTGVDEFTSITLNFANLQAQGIATTNMSVKTPQSYCVLVQGEKADLSIPWAPYRPESFTIHQKDQDGNYTGENETKEFKIPGHGMFWEADAAARALRDGKKETEKCSLDESVLTMQIMDKVRYENDFTYPKSIEGTRSDA